VVRKKRTVTRRKTGRKRSFTSGLGTKLMNAALSPHVLSTVSKLSGFGDYKVAQNSMMSLGGNPPAIHNTARHSSGGVVIRHREYIADITPSTAFFNQYQLLLNPGNEFAFPWLSQVASAFEEFKWRGMCFEFKSMAGDFTNNTNGALGTVIMATSYNVLKNIFPDKSTMENHEFSNSTKASCNMLHPIECKKSETPGGGELWITSEGQTAGNDPRLYFPGLFQVATQGFSSTNPGTTIGELWCTFEVELLKPTLVSGTGTSLLQDVYKLPPLVAGAQSTSLNPFAFELGPANDVFVFKPNAGSSGFTQMVFTTNNAGTDLFDCNLQFLQQAANKTFMVIVSLGRNQALLSECRIVGTPTGALTPTNYFNNATQTSRNGWSDPFPTTTDYAAVFVVKVGPIVNATTQLHFTWLLNALQITYPVITGLSNINVIQLNSQISG